jgi:uncharacterized protein (UPF0276 family)
LIGVSLGGDSTARWLEGEPDAVDCLEIVAEGFFARPSPYLAWLGQHFPLIVKAPSLSIGTPGSIDAERLEAVANVAVASQSRLTVHPLGFCEAGEIRLNTPVPISLTLVSLEMVGEHVIQATARVGRPALIEPITAPLRVPGSLAETDFLVHLCRKADCRLLIDVTTLLVASRNHGFDPHAWLLAIPDNLIAVARIGGSSFLDGRWSHDVRGDIDEAAWALAADVVSHAHPDVFVLGTRERYDGIDELGRDLARLRRIKRAPGVARDSTSPNRAGGRTPSLTPVRVREAAAKPALSSTPVNAGGWSDAPAPASGRTRHPQIAPDVALFVLDDEGVFFSKERRKLSLFNTPATLVWCLLEDGLAVGEITEGYRVAFGLPQSEAERHVGTILQRWFGLGYITNPGPTGGDEVPLTTAMAQVLTNARLRLQFRQSRQEVAEALHVACEDLDTFTGLDADELDAQADEVARFRSVRGRPVAARASNEDDDLPSARAPVAGREQRAPSGPGRRYRLLTTTFEVHADSKEIAERVHRSLAHLERPDQPPDVVLDLRPSESGGWVVSDRNVPVAQCRGTEDMVPAVKLLLREMAVNRYTFLINVHAGVVSFGDGCMLLPASTGSGKTTLTAALIRSGATYFSDELAPLEEGTLAVRPLPLALTIKDGSVEALRRLYPELGALTSHVREDYVRVRYLPPPAGSLPADDAPQPVRWIVFPRYAPVSETVLRPLSRPMALRRLLDESFVPLERLDREKVESLVQWMRTVECFELPLSSLDTAVGLLRSLMQGRIAE